MAATIISKQELIALYRQGKLEAEHILENYGESTLHEVHEHLQQEQYTQHYS